MGHIFINFRGRDFWGQTREIIPRRSVFLDTGRDIKLHNSYFKVSRPFGTGRRAQPSSAEAAVSHFR